MGQEAHFAYPSLSLYKGKKICHARARRVNEVGGHTLPNHLSLACAGSAIPWLRDAAAPRRTLRTTVWGVTVSSKLPEPSHLWTDSHHSGFPRQMKGLHCRRPRPSPHGPHPWIGAPHHVRSPRTCPDPIPAFCEILHPLTYARAGRPCRFGGRAQGAQGSLNLVLRVRRGRTQR